MVPEAAAGDEQGFLLVLLADDGWVHVSAPAVRSYGRDLSAPDVVLPGQVLETLHSAVAVAGHIASETTGYQGPWRAGVLVTSLRGVVPSQARSHVGGRRFAPYPSEEYLVIR